MPNRGIFCLDFPQLYTAELQGPFMDQNCRLFGLKSRLASVIKGVGTTENGGLDN